VTPRRRCARGHFISAAAATDACNCVLTRRPRRRRSYCATDLWGQGLTARQRHSITTIPLTGRYL
jgi:hypothetical protein